MAGRSTRTASSSFTASALSSSFLREDEGDAVRLQEQAEVQVGGKRLEVVVVDVVLFIEPLLGDEPEARPSTFSEPSNTRRRRGANLFFRWLDARR